MADQGFNNLRSDAELGVAGAIEALTAYHRYWSDQRGETETCAACGSAASMFCPMSDDGEGSHQLVARQAVSADDAAFITRYDVHSEQGAAER